MAITAASYNQPSVPARFQQARQSLLALKTTLQQPKSKETVSFEPRYGSRIRFISENVYASRASYATRDVYETRDVTEEQPVYETRPTYTDSPIFETKVTGTRNLGSYNAAISAGLDEKADFSVQVGAGAAVRVQFTGASITVTQNGTTQAYAYTATSGSFQSALTSALGSVAGLTADLDSQGHLSLGTTAAQSLTLAEVTNDALDLSGTALDKLGLSAGTTDASQTGTVRTQTGTENVQTGTTSVVVGQERVKTGTETFQTGKETYVAGSQLVENGTESTIVAYDRVVTTTDLSSLEGRTKQVSARQAMVSLVKAAQSEVGNAGAVGTSIAKGFSQIISVLGSADTLTIDKIDGAVKDLDKARAAYMISAFSGSGATLSKSV